MAMGKTIMLTGRKLGLRTIWGTDSEPEQQKVRCYPGHTAVKHTSPVASQAPLSALMNPEERRYLHGSGNGEHGSRLISTYQGECQEGYWSLWVIMRYRLLPKASCGKMAQDSLFFLQRQGGCSICYPDPSLQAWGQSCLRPHSWPWPRQHTLKM